MMGESEKSPTFCNTCRRAEMTPWQRFMEPFLGPKNPDDLISLIGSNFSNAISVAMGTPMKTDYDRHRKLWIQTGDQVELERMRRHVR